MENNNEINVIKGFNHKTGVHCTSSALRNIFEFYGLKLSEEMIFGIGGGLGLGYLKFKNQNPMIGGRQNDFEKNLAKLMNTPLKIYRTKDKEEGWNHLRSYLENNKPMAINIDMAYLPYHKGDLPREDYHFGMHTVVVCGYNPKKNTVSLADTAYEEIQEITVEELSAGRNASYNRWLDPYNFIYEFDFNQKRPDLVEIIPQAIRNNGNSLQKSSKLMTFMGIYSGPKGLNKFAEDLGTWPKLSKNILLEQCKEISGYISHYGTGGGFFRFLYSRFLLECAELLEDNRLSDLSDNYDSLGKEWEDFSDHLEKFPLKGEEEEVLVLQKLLMNIIHLERENAKKLANYWHP
ncbi:MAG: DUF4872 domain-containing protein [Candidatus Heimdallarchaeota archaeon]|nr:DUF4872 domain-containing protein [Candidatus Heimdallarchaeota archaeon]